MSNHNTNLLHKVILNTIQTGAYGNAEGVDTKATGAYSHAEGRDSTASGNNSHSEGGSIASNISSHAEGSETTASGYYSHSEGKATTASGYCSHVMGTFSKALVGSASSYSATADAFVIGNGTYYNAVANAFRVTFDGKTYGLSAFNSTGADYAEFFEWEDGNPNVEDRVGRFVTLDGEKIRKAISSDDYILGIISVNPSVVGDSYNDDWSGKYVTDEWGRTQYHDVVVPATEETPEHTDYVPMLNPAWNPGTPYVPREKRPEWSTVGMMGKLFVRDDGTCQVNGYCEPNNDGTATASATGYRVMKRVAANIVQVLLK